MMLPMIITTLAVGAMATKKNPMKKLALRCECRHATAASAAARHSASATSAAASSQSNRQPNNGTALKE